MASGTVNHVADPGPVPAGAPNGNEGQRYDTPPHETVDVPRAGTLTRLCHHIPTMLTMILLAGLGAFMLAGSCRSSRHLPARGPRSGRIGVTSMGCPSHSVSNAIPPCCHEVRISAGARSMAFRTAPCVILKLRS
jgi:hypothetical protein